jgi:addiction module HigA family antidote
MTIKREELETGRFKYSDPYVDSSARRLSPVHPGEILRDEFLEPAGISAYRLAADIRVTPNRVSEMVHGRRAISADTALRLGRYFGNTAAFWMNLQSAYELAMTNRDHGAKIVREVSTFVSR